MNLLRITIMPIISRVARRYPGVALVLVVWRWWRRRSARRSRRVVRIGPNETLTIEQKDRAS